MKRSETVKLKKDFDYIINNGKVLKNKCYSVYYVKNNVNKKLFGIGVSKKLGNAVYRNKVKRQLRHIIDNNKQIFNNNYSYIIIIKRNGSNLSFKDKEINLISLFKEENNEK